MRIDIRPLLKAIDLFKMWVEDTFLETKLVYVGVYTLDPEQPIGSEMNPFQCFETARESMAKWLKAKKNRRVKYHSMNYPPLIGLRRDLVINREIAPYGY